MNPLQLITQAYNSAYLDRNWYGQQILHSIFQYLATGETTNSVSKYLIDHGEYDGVRFASREEFLRRFAR